MDGKLASCAIYENRPRICWVYRCDKAKAMLSAAQRCAEVLDDILIQGWKPDGTNYVISGLHQSANNDYSTSTDFGTFRNPLKAVTGDLTLLWADNVNEVNFNLVLHPTQYAELIKSVSTGVIEYDEVMKLLALIPDMLKGQVIMSNDLTDSTGILSPVDPRDCTSRR
ncbi:MAG: YkgJ family cysteine cluster protein [Methanomassiliicoccales archaeon]|nr:YkgJ family cysteine cluster protein [Methanomassiliicoccales archaeon]